MKYETSELARLGIARWLEVVTHHKGTLDDLAKKAAEEIVKESDPEMRHGIALAAVLTAYNTGLRDRP